MSEGERGGRCWRRERGGSCWRGRGEGDIGGGEEREMLVEGASKGGYDAPPPFFFVYRDLLSEKRLLSYVGVARVPFDHKSGPLLPSCLGSLTVKYNVDNLHTFCCWRCC